MHIKTLLVVLCLIWAANGKPFDAAKAAPHTEIVELRKERDSLAEYVKQDMEQRKEIDLWINIL